MYAPPPLVPTSFIEELVTLIGKRDLSGKKMSAILMWSFSGYATFATLCVLVSDNFRRFVVIVIKFLFPVTEKKNCAKESSYERIKNFCEKTAQTCIKG